MCGCSVACRCKVDDRCVQTEHLTLYDTLYYDSKHKADNAPTESEGPNKRAICANETCSTCIYAPASSQRGPCEGMWQPCRRLCEGGSLLTWPHAVAVAVAVAVAARAVRRVLEVGRFRKPPGNSQLMNPFGPRVLGHVLPSLPRAFSAAAAVDNRRPDNEGD